MSNTDRLRIHFLLFVLLYFGDLCRCQDHAFLSRLVVILRHGARTPFQTYKNDPYRNFSHWPEGIAQLTNEGKIQLYEFGQWLRSYYDEYLPEEYRASDIYVRSTDTDRSLMSAASALAGLYPPTEKEIWNPKVLWQPIPIHTVAYKNDMVIGYAECPRHKQLLTELLSSAHFTKVNASLQPLYQYLTIHTGQAVETWEGIVNLYDCLLIEQHYNLTLPEWTQVVFPHKMLPTVHLRNAIFTYTRELASLKIGPLFDEILTYLLAKEANNRLVIYSAHESTLVNILNALGAFDYQAAPYASAVIFELRETYEGEFVSLLYKNSSRPVYLKMQGCEVQCEIDKFVDMMSRISLTASQWNDECNTLRKDDNIVALVFLFFIASVVCLVLLFVILYYLTRFCILPRLSVYL